MFCLLYKGPQSTTNNDFWRMVFQENVTQIVMLTNLTEGEKVVFKNEMMNSKRSNKNTIYDIGLIDL